MTQPAPPIENIIAAARQGDRGSSEMLAQALIERLRVDVYRLTLDRTATEEIVQDCLVQVLESLHQLRDTQSFWGWTYKIAVNKVRENYRKQAARREVPLDNAAAAAHSGQNGPDAVAEALSKEVKQAVLAAMAELTPDQRALLTMRCYRNMEYSEIAESLGCGRFAARMRFHRAKKALGARLARKGLGKGAIVVALLIFGKFTAESEAAVTAATVAGASLKVGPAAAAAAFLLGKAGIVTVATVAAIGIGGITVDNIIENRYPSQIDAPADTLVRMPAAIDDQTRQEWSYFYPRGEDGPVMMRIMEAQSQNTPLRCIVKQDYQANYFLGRDGSVYMKNHCPYNSDLTVMRLPTDSVSFRRFLTARDGVRSDLGYVPAAEPGLLVVNTSEGDTSSVIHHYYMIEQQHFAYAFPAAAEIIDQRDRMHKTGWTYFRLTGELNAEPLTGTGRIPFNVFYAEVNPPWLQIEACGGQLADTAFEGLSRPWTGLHTIDVVRRDAAKQNIPFKTHHIPGSTEAAVTLAYPDSDVEYQIDLDRDIITKITFAGATNGHILFQYLDKTAAHEFSKPPRPASHNLINWLIRGPNDGSALK